MKTKRSRKALTFGDLIATVYTGCPKGRASGILALAVNARFGVFRGPDRYVIC